MAYVLADNIISPLGDTSEENYLAVKFNKSSIRAYLPGSMGIPEGFAAALMSSSFEELALRSANKALKASGIDVVHDRVKFILSSTKGSIERLGKDTDENVSLGTAAQRMAKALGIKTKPIVVCNACVSGLSALILASRLLEQDKYDYAVVCGADCPSKFIISGFQSLKALSAEPCRPFDMERLGLNLGEAAATIVLAKNIPHKAKDGKTIGGLWQLTRGVVKNDASHISTPSKTGEGLYRSVLDTIQDVAKEDLAFINAHGTATLFNDQMESIAIQRAGLSDMPINALKGYLGHTLGAAGVLETILSMKAADDHIVIGTRGYKELGVSGKINISAENRFTDQQAFIKILSGFGGCNAAILARKAEAVATPPYAPPRQKAERRTITKKHQVRISPKGVWVDGNPIPTENENGNTTPFTAIYKQKIGEYPKHYKMDALCRLGFVASELLLQAEGKTRFEECDDRAVVLFNRSSSIYSDKKYLASICDKENYFPSPSVFIYTLPNIVTGEIAIRNGYHGDTSFYILPSKDEEQMLEILETAFLDRQTTSVLAGWLDYEDAEHYEAELYIAEQA